MRVIEPKQRRSQSLDIDGFQQCWEILGLRENFQDFERVLNQHSSKEVYVGRIFNQGREDEISHKVSLYEDRSVGKRKGGEEDLT